LLHEANRFDFELRRIEGNRACHRDTSLGSPQSSGVHQTGSTPRTTDQSTCLPQQLAHDPSRIRYGYQHSLRKRIKQELNSIAYDLRKYICGSDAFVKVVVDTRNYLTHYEKDDDGLVLESPLDLMIAVRRLRIFLIILLLKDIGFTEPRIIEAFG